MLTSLRWSSTLFLITLAFASFPVCGQLKQVDRLEIPLEGFDRAENHKVISAHEAGIVIYDFVATPTDHHINLTFIDTTLHLKWEGSMVVSKAMAPRYARVKDEKLYILCSSQNQNDGSFEILEVNLRSQSFQTYNIQNFIAFTPKEFVILTNAVLIGGYFNYRPFILHYSLLTRQGKMLPGFFNEPGELLQVKSVENGTVDIIVNAKNAERKKCLWIRSYDGDGNLIKTTILEPGEGKNLIFGRSVQTDGDAEVVAGVYGRNADIARGIFVAHIDTHGEYVIRYYNFADLKNFFRYMKAKRQTRVQERIERRRVQGKKIKFNYRFLVHELIPYGDQYVMLGEAFYPQYRTQGNGLGGTVIYPNTYSNPRSSRADFVFDGYQYTHAVVIGFSAEGKLLWDNSFEINDVKSFRLDQFVKIQPKKDNINLFYLYDNTIRSKVIKGAQVVEGKTLEDIQARFTTDKVFNDHYTGNRLEYWYPGCFFAYGEQRISNTQDLQVPLTRRVFFITKLTDR